MSDAQTQIVCRSAGLARQAVTCRVRNSLYAIGLDDVQEIVRLSQVTSLPKTSQELNGLISLRGDMVPVIDLGLVMQDQPMIPANETRVIVVQFENDSKGILVDEVFEVDTFESGEITVPDSEFESIDQPWIFGYSQRNEELVTHIEIGLMIGEKKAA